MRKCERCGHSKPDAVFPPDDETYADGHHRHSRKGWCLHCRGIEAHMGMKTTPLPPPSPALIEVSGSWGRIFRRELEKWRERGARVIERPYTHVHGKMASRGGAGGLDSFV